VGRTFCVILTEVTESSFFKAFNQTSLHHA
jgi:hypothetical protein